MASLSLIHLSRTDEKLFFRTIHEQKLLVNQEMQQPNFVVESLSHGDYFWAVPAYDSDHHIRFGNSRYGPVAKFHITAPDPKVIAINFDYSPWITEDDYQGKIRCTIRNEGDRLAENFSVSIFDSVLESRNDLTAEELENKSLAVEALPIIEAGEQATVELDWNTTIHGNHWLTAVINQDDQTINHRDHADFYTIPKGTFATDDTVVVQKLFETIHDLPYLGKVFFDSSSAEVAVKYYKDWVIRPPLALFAWRLEKNPSVKISLQGTIDPNSGENDVALADERAEAVRDTLHHLGVSNSQMKIESGVKLPRRRVPAKAEDARWVFEERRRVDIRTKKEWEKILFDPLQTVFVSKENVPVLFRSNIIGVVSVQNAGLKINMEQQEQQVPIEEISGTDIVQNISWLTDQKKGEMWEDCLGKDIGYSLILTDTLERQFKVRPKTTCFNAEVAGLERRYFVLARFESTEAFYNFSWTGLLEVIPYLMRDERTRIRFIGHGCATGSDAINDWLSIKRANDFQNKLLADVKIQYPELYDSIRKRFDPPQGMGEQQPFEIKDNQGKTILIGDNNQPLGRQLNRRVMVFIYTAQ